MSRLFVFGIGGTGSRVIKSLSMLMAAGVSFGKNISEIVPIIIDVDKANEDLTRTIEILKNYKAISDRITSDSDEYRGFFESKLTDLFPLNGNEFKFTVENVQGKKFGEYIDHQTLTGVNKMLSELLFSGTQENNGKPISLLDLDMKEGFQGNPKLGSVVLNQFRGNNDFDTFAQNFNKGDRIFIISSIYGGTGAAGFPLLVKNLRNAQLPTPNSAFLQSSLIGAVTVLPYFTLKDGDIKSQDFISKSKAALEYYINNVNPALNSLYYIGYNANTNYTNVRGGKQQKNPAHFIELAAALSVIDFALQPTASVAQQGARFLEYGINDFENVIDFTMLGPQTQSIIVKPLIKFYLLHLYLSVQIKKSINKQPWSSGGKIKINQEFIETEMGFYKDLVRFMKYYEEWLIEMSRNTPAFVPFELDINGQQNRVFDSLSGFSSNKSLWKDNFALFDDILNQVARQTKGMTIEMKLIELFNMATSELINKKYKF